MQKNKKQKEIKPVAPSQSGRRRGEVEESKLPKILMTAGVGLLVALVVALIIALIVVSVTNRKPQESPVKDEIHISYQNLTSIVVDKQLAALNEQESTRDAYQELIKEKSYIIFYRTQDLKNKEFVQAIKDAKKDNVGVVLVDLAVHDQILGEDDTILKEIEYSDPKLLPFVIVVSGSDHNEFEFVGEMDRVLSLLKK